ncbi:hypothetical protein S40293_01402 [Stachybotrys chartarum IBT 40293]|nr:hypothetical protein S40293_01402 [Stachybotrys chartarum IBT 40293]KFA77336.1 hypothetical protein S40288_04342 [Stachybotrys chartarum IBT 40288]
MSSLLHAPKQLCVYPRCRLCRFKIVEGNRVVVGEISVDVFELVVANRYPNAVVLDNRQSLPFSYHYDAVHHDAMLQRTISCCSASCSHWNEERAVTCHQACMIFAAKFETFQPSSFFSFLFAQKQPTIPAMTVLDSGYKAHLMREKQASTSWTMRKLLTSLQLSPIDTSSANASDGSPISRMWSATNYWYEPPHSEETRRRDATVESIRRGLAVNVDPCGKLPWEILTMIANYLVPEFAITELLTTPRSNDSRFTVSKDVWATYVNIDGTEYVSSLSNLRSDKARLVLQAGSTCLDNAIYILEDHLGIRRVEISSSPPKLADPSDRSMWWRSLPIQEDELVFASDGVKLQCLRESSNLNRTSWASPTSPLNQTSLFTYHISAGNGVSRMVPVDLNLPGCVGYSACWSTFSRRGALVHLQAHRVGESLDYYRDPERSQPWNLWTYMPVAEGEQIKEIWCRKGRPSFEIALAFKTSKGRTITMGSYIFPENHVFDWKCVAQPRGSDQLWFDYSSVATDAVRKFASSRWDFDALGDAPAQTTYSLPPQFSTNNDQPGEIFHSSASLKDVTEVVTCRTNDGCTGRITGLLLRYKDDSEACLGSYRLDYNLTLSLVEPSSLGLFVGAVSGESCWFVGEIDTCLPFERRSLTWQSFPWKGVLEWWFNGEQSVVHHAPDAPSGAMSV